MSLSGEEQVVYLLLWALDSGDRIAGGFVGGRRRDCAWAWVVGEEEGKGGLDLAGVVVNHPCPEGCRAWGGEGWQPGPKDGWVSMMMLLIIFRQGGHGGRSAHVLRNYVPLSRSDRHQSNRPCRRADIHVACAEGVVITLNAYRRRRRNKSHAQNPPMPKLSYNPNSSIKSIHLTISA